MTLPSKELGEYLRRQIPLAAAMDVTVDAADAAGVRLRAPLPPNVNHHGTVFGGSISALALLSAWTALHLRLHAEAIPSELVIQRNTVEYLRPVEDVLEAFCAGPPAADWERFVSTLCRRGRARVVVRAELRSAGELVATFQGSFVATRTEGESLVAGG